MQVTLSDELNSALDTLIAKLDGGEPSTDRMTLLLLAAICMSPGSDLPKLFPPSAHVQVNRVQAAIEGWSARLASDLIQSRDLYRDQPGRKR